MVASSELSKADSMEMQTVAYSEPHWVVYSDTRSADLTELHSAASMVWSTVDPMVLVTAGRKAIPTVDSMVWSSVVEMVHWSVDCWACYSVESSA